MAKAQPVSIPEFNAEDAANMGVGLENSVRYSINLPGRTIEIRRCLEPVHNLIYDPTNPRLRTKLLSMGVDPTQDNLHAMLLKEVENDLIPGLMVTKGLSTPIIVHRTKEGNKVIEGNRRTRAYRELCGRDARFGYIPVEYLPDDISQAEINTYLVVRHCTRAKPWESREQAYMVQECLKDMPIEDVSTVVGRTVAHVQSLLEAAGLYDEFDKFAQKHQNLGDEKTRSRDFFTYFAKLTGRKNVKEEILPHKELREKIFSMMLKGQFNDCLNMDHFYKVWNTPASRKFLEEGGSFQEAVRTYTNDCSQRRATDLWPSVKKSLSGLKKLTKKDISRLAAAEGSKDFHLLRQLGNIIEKIVMDAEQYKTE